MLVILFLSRFCYLFFFSVLPPPVKQFFLFVSFITSLSFNRQLNGVALRKLLNHVPHVDARLLSNGAAVDFNDLVADFQV